MPKVVAPKAPKKIQIKGLRATSGIRISKTIKEQGEKLDRLETRVFKDSNDIDTLFINYEQIKTQNETAMVLTCGALVLAFVALILAVS